MITRYFVYRDRDGSVSTLFKAEFDETRLASQNYWDSRAEAWKQTKLVGKWYFMGDTDMDESTEHEAMATIDLWRVKYPPRG